MIYAITLYWLFFILHIFISLQPIAAEWNIDKIIIIASTTITKMPHNI